MAAGTGRVAVSGRVAVANRGPFAPTQLSGCLVWLDASDVTSIVKDGSNNVSTWGDKSGNANNASEATNQPIYTAAFQNGLAALQYTASRKLTTPAISLGAFTVVHVWKDTSHATGAMIYEHASVGGGNGAWLYGDNDGTGSMVVKKGGTTTGKNLGATWALNSRTNLTIHTYDGTNAGHLVRLNGAQATTTAGGASSDPGTGAVSGAFVVGRSDGSAAQGYRMELIIYSRVLSGSEITQVENYLQPKWGI